jgi:hypothetical protein
MASYLQRQRAYSLEEDPKPKEAPKPAKEAPKPVIEPIPGFTCVAIIPYARVDALKGRKDGVPLSEYLGAGAKLPFDDGTVRSISNSESLKGDNAETAATRAYVYLLGGGKYFAGFRNNDEKKSFLVVWKVEDKAEEKRNEAYTPWKVVAESPMPAEGLGFVKNGQGIKWMGEERKISVVMGGESLRLIVLEGGKENRLFLDQSGQERSGNSSIFIEGIDYRISGSFKASGLFKISGVDGLFIAIESQGKMVVLSQ